MTRIFAILALLCTPLLLLAQEVAAETPDLDPSSLSGWQYAVYTAVIAIVGLALNLWRKRVNASRDKDTAITGEHLLKNRELLLARIESTAFRAAENHVADHLPALAVDALNGDGEFDVKAHAMNAYRSVRKAVIDDFKAEGIDIVARIGESRLNGLIKKGVDAAITALPDKVEAFLPGPVKDLVSKFVADFVASKTAGWIEEAVKA